MSISSYESARFRSAMTRRATIVRAKTTTNDTVDSERKKVLRSYYAAFCASLLEGSDGRCNGGLK